MFGPKSQDQEGDRRGDAGPGEWELESSAKRRLVVANALGRQQANPDDYRVTLGNARYVGKLSTKMCDKAVAAFLRRCAPPLRYLQSIHVWFMHPSSAADRWNVRHWSNRI